MTERSAFLFDVNHTLVGFFDESVAQSAAIDVLYGSVCALKDQALDRQEFRATFDRSWAEGKRASFEKYEETTYESIVEWVLDQYGLTLSPDELETLLQIYMAPLYDAAYVIEGMNDVLSSVAVLGQVGVVTNYKYDSGMRGILDRVGLLDHLNAVSVSSKVGWKKPDERLYQDALDQMGVSAEQVVLVGNELEKDLWRGHRMGMRTILFETAEHAMHDVEFAEILRQRLDTTNIQVDAVATTPEELRQALEKLAR